MIENAPLPSPSRSPRSVFRAVSTFVALASAAALLGVTSHAGAEPTDPGGAREQLKIGFSLKQQNKCGEALPHFEESLRLDPSTAKARLNMADCLETVGQLVRAAKEWALLRDQATEDAMKDEAKKRLAAVEKRLPKLEVRIAGDRTGTLVRRDGVELRGLSLDVALPVDPGPHTLVLEREGHEPSTSSITLAEGETKTVTLALGPKRQVSAPVPPPSASAAPPPSTTAHASADVTPAPPKGMGTQQVAGLALGGVGVVAIGFATYAFVSAKSKNDDAAAMCSATSCPAAAFSKHDDAKSLAKTGNIAFVAGALLASGGAALYFTGKPTEARPTAKAAPVVGPGSLGVAFQGSF